MCIRDSSVMAPMQLRERAWKRLSENININKLEEMTIDASLDQVEGLANEILQGKVRGRVIVNISE